MFCGPCIVIYLRNKSQQDALFYYQFIAIINNLYMLRASLMFIIRRFTALYIQQLVGVMLKIMEAFTIT